MDGIDEFTKRMKEKANARNRRLGRLDDITFRTNEDLNELTYENTEQRPLLTPQEQTNTTTTSSGRVLLEKSQIVSAPGQKTLHHFSTVKNSENSDLDIEINIRADQLVGVQVEVEEREISDEYEYENINPSQQQPKLRDASRNQLQRLGALYSNSDISSPIHRTEEGFHADDAPCDEQAPKHKQRFGKLVALANTINEWEDDLTHHDLKRTKNADDATKRVDKGVKKAPAPKPPVAQPKTRNWDAKLLNSLEAQGFERREDKVVYDYVNDEQANKRQAAAKRDAAGQQERSDKTTNKPAETCVSSSGLVSGRAAIFEQKSASNQAAYAKKKDTQKPEKDPSEMSLKERLKIFERNKSGAVLPKAPITMAPTLTQLREQATPAVVAATTTSPTKRRSYENVKLKSVSEKVAALTANAQSATERQRQIEQERQEDMKVITNRFNKQKEINAQQQQQHQHQQQIQKMAAPPPPPPPPAPAAPAMPRESLGSAPYGSACMANAKRRSSTATDDNSDCDAKRPRQLYPSLSPLKTSDNNTSETASLHSLNNEDDDDVGSTDTSDVSSGNLSHDSFNDTNQSNSEMANTTLGRKVRAAVKAAQQHLKKTVHFGKCHNNQADCESSLNSTSFESDDMDCYLNEALGANEPRCYDDSECENDAMNASGLSKGSKHTVTSNSFLYQKSASGCPTINECEVLQTPSNNNNDRIYQPTTSHLSVERDENDTVKLVHTVSFYRRQQNTNSAGATPYRKITRNRELDIGGAKQKLQYDDSPQHEAENTEIAGENENQQEEAQDGDEFEEQISVARVEEKIKKMLEEITKQQQMIGQTSQAINLCASTVEFAGSTESVEFERVLLLATHRRQACLDEVQRLRVDKTLRATNHPNECGLLTVKEITIPLRQDYLRKMAQGTITGHHLVCLLKYNEHVLATKSIPTMPGLVTVKFPDVLQLPSVYADFLVTLEIYGMIAHREQLPHEVKYHINLNNKKGGVKTPKKKGSSNNVLVRPPIQSPAGPNAVRSPQFVRYAYAIFSLREIQRTAWTLTETNPLSPLDKTVHMKINCELTVSLEYRGFLTMFEEISGFGAWHRRWCCLNGTKLKYWKYPDDEKRKSPMGYIDLHTCTTKNVSVAPRDLCARLNTILLESQRPAKDNDVESLIVVPHGDVTIIRYLLSADTREDRDEWIVYLNKALLLARAWGRSNSNSNSSN